MLSGGTVAITFAYLALQNSYRCTLGVPFEFLYHSPLGISRIFAPLIAGVIVLYLFHLGLLSLAYGVRGIGTGQAGTNARITEAAWKWADRFFFFGTVGIFVIAVVFLPLRVAEYFGSGGQYPTSSQDVARCIAQWQGYLNGTVTSPPP